ncbi:MAG: hypothetical protein ACE5F1_23105, partial [Planctomycetota bacterium]
ITEIAFASCSTGIRKLASIVVKMDQLGSRTKLSAEFSKNLTPNARTVLIANRYYWHHEKDKWSSIGLQSPFPFDPRKGSLVIDIEVRGARFLAEEGGGFRRANSVARLYAVGWKLAPPKSGTLSPAGLKIRISSELSELGLFGIGCKGSNGKTPSLTLSGSSRLGGKVQVRLANALPATLGLLIAGFDNKPPAFPLPTNAPGCFLFHSFEIVLPFQTDKAGGHTLPFPIPNHNALRHQRLYTQFSVVDQKANSAWMTMSNYGRILIGR